jgi:hypothetical protein
MWQAPVNTKETLVPLEQGKLWVGQLSLHLKNEHATWSQLAWKWQLRAYERPCDSFAVLPCIGRLSLLVSKFWGCHTTCNRSKALTEGSLETNYLETYWSSAGNSADRQQKRSGHLTQRPIAVLSEEAIRRKLYRRMSHQDTHSISAELW